MQSSAPDVDTYIVEAPEARRGALGRLRALCREALPDADELILYGMPAYRLAGELLVCFRQPEEPPVDLRLQGRGAAPGRDARRRRSWQRLRAVQEDGRDRLRRLARDPSRRCRPRGIDALTDREVLTIESVGAQGDGVSSAGSFVPLTLPGERVAAIGEGGRRELAEVLAPSPCRVMPPCPHFGVCGGCALQHWDLTAYRAWKVDQVRLTLGRARIDAEVSLLFAAEPHSRRRLSLHARRSGGRAVLGFKERRSWALAVIETCVIADRRIVAALPSLRDLALPFLEHPKSAPILHVTITESGLDVDVTGVERKSGGLSADAQVRIGQIAAAGDFARVTLAGEMVYQSRAPTIRFGSARVELPPGSFLQAVAGAEQAMAGVVAAASAGAKRIADLYCGAGAFTFQLASVAPVVAVDSSAAAIRSLTKAIATAPGLKSIQGETRDLDRRPLLAADLAKIDVAVFDPPRAGAKAQAAQFALSKVGRVVAVSCNPVTFVRDAGLLIAGGYRLERVAVVDQFLWSPHIELVAVFSRVGA